MFLTVSYLYRKKYTYGIQFSSFCLSPPPPPPRIEAAVADLICMPQDVSPHFRRYGELSTRFYTECHNNSIALRPDM